MTTNFAFLRIWLRNQHLYVYTLPSCTLFLRQQPRCIQMIWLLINTAVWFALEDGSSLQLLSGYCNLQELCTGIVGKLELGYKPPLFLILPPPFFLSRHPFNWRFLTPILFTIHFTFVLRLLVHTILLTEHRFYPSFTNHHQQPPTTSGWVASLLLSLLWYIFLG